MSYYCFAVHFFIMIGASSIVTKKKYSRYNIHAPTTRNPPWCLDVIVMMFVKGSFQQRKLGMNQTLIASHRMDLFAVAHCLPSPNTVMNLIESTT